MEVAQVESLIRFSPDKYVRVPIEGTEGLVRLLCFEPHQTVPLHRHPEADEVFYVLNGGGEVMVGSREGEGEGGLFC